MERCPFGYGRALQPEEFLNKGSALRWVPGQMVSDQSAALIGQPHIEHTSLIKFLLSAGSRQSAVGRTLYQQLCSYRETHRVSDEFDQAAFRKRALSPLRSQFSAGPRDERYKIAGEKDFVLVSLMSKGGRNATKHHE